MQLKFERDFFIRPARASDLKEAVALVADTHSTAISAEVNGVFLGDLARTDLLIRVILNSNGVLIGFFLANHERLITLAINPNFLRREVRDEVTHQLKAWAESQNHAKLLIPREISANEWKAIWKQSGFKVEPGVAGTELLDFS